ncbi:MAG: glutathione S-transferase family protein [Cellvibrionaceae bacterium]
MTIPTLELITFALCPYVQRSIIVLKEKGIAHTRTDIDLNSKPEGFEALSPLGKVPLLIVDNHQPIFESAVICEYLDEITPNTLLPENALEKAYHKAWIEFGSHLLNKIAALYSAASKTAFDVTLKDLRTRFEMLESEISSQPYFSGKGFRMIDASYAPIFRYFDVFEQYFHTNLFDDLSKVCHWRAQLKKRHSVREAVQSDYSILLAEFLLKKESYLAGLIQSNSHST